MNAVIGRLVKSRNNGMPVVDYVWSHGIQAVLTNAYSVEDAIKGWKPPEFSDEFWDGMAEDAYRILA